jgi:putative transposase
MQWVMTSHVCYYHKKNQTSGHIWQGRFKSFIVQKDNYYLTLLRYIKSQCSQSKPKQNSTRLAIRLTSRESL